MKNLFSASIIALAGLGFTACETQRSASATETTTTTTEAVSPSAAVTATSPTDTSSATLQPTDAGEVSPDKVSGSAFVSETDFIMKAAEMSTAEVKLGALAERKTFNPEVKQFAVQIVQDHTRANNLLLRIAQKRNVATPSEMDAGHQQDYSNLATVMSDEFDQGFMAQMVKDHEKAVAMFLNASRKITDAELKSFVTSTMPNLKRHLGLARDLQQKIEASR